MTSHLKIGYGCGIKSKAEISSTVKKLTALGAKGLNQKDATQKNITKRNVNKPFPHKTTTANREEIKTHKKTTTSL